MPSAPLTMAQASLTLGSVLSAGCRTSVPAGAVTVTV